MKIVDPFGNLRRHHADAVAQAMQSDAAAYIRWSIAEHLVDLEDNDDLEEPYTRGYRMALRVAYIAAGGQVDGSEEGWAAVVEAARG